MPGKSALSFEVLKTRDFTRLMLARMIGVSALQAQAVIIGWQIYELTRDPLLLGLTGLAEAVPALSCALFAGNIVDKTRPQRVGAMCFGALVLNTLALYLIGSGIVDLHVSSFLPVAYAAVFISGAVRSFIMPSSFALLAQIVPRPLISAATAWMGSGFQVSVIIAPALTGIIYGLLGPKVAWAIPLYCMIIAFLLMLRIDPGPRRPPPVHKETMSQAIRAGFAFLLSKPVLLAAMSLDMVAVLFGGAVALLPAFASEVLLAGPEALGQLRSAPALGAVCMSIFLATRPMRTIPASRMIWVVAGFGVAMIGFGLSKTLWMAMFFLALSGVFDSISVVIRQTIMQLLTPPHMRGRVSSVSSMFVISSNELGAFESGVLARLIGLIPAIVVGGAGSIITAAATVWFVPSLRTTVITAADEIPVKPAPTLENEQAEETALRKD